MEEINAIHNPEVEWGCVISLMAKIGDIEDNIEGGWLELTDMVADAVDMEEANNTPSDKLFFNLYGFLWRLYYRLKTNPTPRKFNIVSTITILGEDGYRITNYDYLTYKWAKSGGFSDSISNDYIDILAKKMTEKQRRTLNRKVKQEEGVK